MDRKEETMNDILGKLADLKNELDQTRHDLNGLPQAVDQFEKKLRSELEAILDRSRPIDGRVFAKGCDELRREKRKMRDLQARLEEIQNAIAVRKDMILGG